MSESVLIDHRSTRHKAQSRTLFDADDIDYLVMNFGLLQLRHERHCADVRAAVCRQWGDEDEHYWREYINALDLAISIAWSLATPPKANKRGRGLRTHGKQLPRAADVKAKNDIVDVIGQHVELRKAGRNLKGRCPFHSDRVPSFVVYPGQQRWWCFACNEGGDVFSFIMRYHSLDFKGALNNLSGRER